MVLWLSLIRTHSCPHAIIIVALIVIASFSQLLSLWLFSLQPCCYSLLLHCAAVGKWPWWSIEAHTCEARRLESKVTWIASKKFFVKEVTALQREVEWWLTKVTAAEAVLVPFLSLNSQYTVANVSGVADQRETEEMPGVELQQGNVDPGCNGEVGATDTEHVRGAKDAAQLRPRREIGKAILGMWKVGDDEVGNITWELGGNANDRNMLNKPAWANPAEKQKELINYFAGQGQSWVWQCDVPQYMMQLRTGEVRRCRGGVSKKGMSCKCMLTCQGKRKKLQYTTWWHCHEREQQPKMSPHTNF
jgi:hypothetical protein